MRSRTARTSVTVALHGGTAILGGPSLTGPTILSSIGITRMQGLQRKNRSCLPKSLLHTAGPSISAVSSIGPGQAFWWNQLICTGLKAGSKCLALAMALNWSPIRAPAVSHDINTGDLVNWGWFLETWWQIGHVEGFLSVSDSWYPGSFLSASYQHGWDIQCDVHWFL